MGVNLHTQWGWWGPALAGGLVLLLIAVMPGLSVVGDRKEWAAAPGHLNALTRAQRKMLPRRSDQL